LSVNGEHVAWGGDSLDMNRLSPGCGHMHFTLSGWAMVLSAT
jgi:hypothetical protein